MGTQVERMRELVPFFVRGADESDVVNEALIVAAAADGRPVAAAAGAAAGAGRKTVEIEVREWDHEEGWFAHRTVLVEDTVSDQRTAGEEEEAAASRGTRTAEAKGAAPRPGSSAKQQRKSNGRKKSPVGSVTVGLTERFAGTSFETKSPAPSQLPIPTHLTSEEDSVRRQLAM
mmetsp:Transcript_11851/g.31873  ORF Transcript_11851/g.31873 Transcript_11851/m.31873 type:complete len:174 (+) Transcript_11851:52-573(+)